MLSNDWSENCFNSNIKSTAAKDKSKEGKCPWIKTHGLNVAIDNYNQSQKFMISDIVTEIKMIRQFHKYVQGCREWMEGCRAMDDGCVTRRRAMVVGFFKSHQIVIRSYYGRKQCLATKSRTLVFDKQYTKLFYVVDKRSLSNVSVLTTVSINKHNPTKAFQTCGHLLCKHKHKKSQTKNNFKKKMCEGLSPWVIYICFFVKEETTGNRT